MKKITILTALVATAVVFYNCHSSKKAAGSAMAKVTYDSNVKSVIETNCTPCHIAGKGNKKPYDNYANVKADIDDIIRRIDMNPGDRGFMPFRSPNKLPEQTIAIFKKFKEDGGLEK